jgi:hypothetical protein
MSEETTSFAPWLEGLKSSDDATFQAAALALWDRMVLQIKARAGKRLGSFPRRAFSESDVANSGFNSFCQGVREGRFPKLDNQNDLWKVLGRIVARKARAYIRAESRGKRGGGRVCGDATSAKPGDSDTPGGFDVLPGSATNPADEMEFEETLTLLDRHDRTLRDIVLLALTRMTNQEIADTLGMALRSVERKRQLIRQLWTASYDL